MILFSGCSFTWGDELQGVEGDHQKRIQKRFSTIATDKQTFNIAECGISNDDIVKKTINFIESWDGVPEFVVVQFTVTDRYAIYDDKWMHVMPWMNKPISKWWFKNIHNEVYAANELWRCVLLLELYLESKKIPYHFMRIDGNITDQVENQDNTYKRASKNKNITRIGRDLIGLHLKTTKPPNPNYCPYINERFGGGHPSEKGHRIIADHLQGILPK